MTGSWWMRWRRLQSGLLSEWSGEGAVGRLPPWLGFWVHVFREFWRNRCQVRAAGLAYTTLLALVPLLAVSISVASLLFDVSRPENRQKLNEGLDYVVRYVAPSLGLEDAPPEASGGAARKGTPHPVGGGDATAGTTTKGSARRAEVANNILAYVSNINFATIGMTAAAGLIFVAISLLRTIEAALNDIWGVSQGRGWFQSIVLYWAAITLGPLLLVVVKSFGYVQAFGSVASRLNQGLGHFVLQVSGVAPLVLLTFTFASLYRLMPNTPVRWSASLVGAGVAASLWWLNNQAANLYNSRVVMYSNIYGSLGILPLFLAGLYLSWLILLLGAQTAYVFQHRQGYLEERRADQIDQTGRELAALRIMSEIGRCFRAGHPGPDMDRLAAGLGIPLRLTRRVVDALRARGLVHEVTPVVVHRRGLVRKVADEVRYAPARPLDHITLAEVWQAVRGRPGGNLVTPDEPLAQAARAELEALVGAAEARGRAVTLAELIQQVPTTA